MAMAANAKTAGMAFQFPAPFLVRRSPDDVLRIRLFLPVFE
jgi:hypothetical protein